MPLLQLANRFFLEHQNLDLLVPEQENVQACERGGGDDRSANTTNEECLDHIKANGVTYTSTTPVLRDA
ncbi:hypothetical protein TNCV_4399851 [Trichonephila clavipes]|nr:hypothetical protein TNCV_4399851 [Trichonephila clavipes]